MRLRVTSADSLEQRSLLRRIAIRIPPLFFVRNLEIPVQGHLEQRPMQETVRVCITCTCARTHHAHLHIRVRIDAHIHTHVHGADEK